MGTPAGSRALCEGTVSQCAPPPPCSNTDTHTVASLLKLYLRELPEPVVPFSQYDCFLACTKLLSKDDATVSNRISPGGGEGRPAPSRELPGPGSRVSPLTSPVGLLEQDTLRLLVNNVHLNWQPLCITGVLNSVNS